ncbi:MAG TPA: hypothetical protein VLQ65_10600 [Saliniramus sp.]|nr:hypothetical protein [Saliniramus sp.]
MRALVAKWLQIRSERDPVLADFWHAADEKLMDSSILFMKGDRDYTYLHHGRYLQERIGFSMQGMNLSELRTRVREQLFGIYDHCTDEFEIAYFQSFSDFQQDVMLWGRICLPLRLNDKDPRVLLLLFCHAIEDKASVFRSLFERSHHAIIIAAPIYDDQRNLQDAWIVGQNDPASKVTGVFDHARDDLLIRASPIFADETLWAYLGQGLANGSVSAKVSSNASGSRYHIFGEMVGEYVVFHLSEENNTDATFEID